MKGPSLPLDLRVLRVFHCHACGRSVYVPGAVTSHLCSCSDPPKFMQAQERPATISPDVTRFLSPPDPRDLEEEPEVELEPYIPFVPKLPPRPASFSSRRKLSDEIEKFVPAEFGDGVDSSKSTADAEGLSESPRVESSSRPEHRNRSRSERPDRQSGPDRGSSGRGGRNDRREPREARGEIRSPAHQPVPQQSDARRFESHEEPQPAEESSPVVGGNALMNESSDGRNRARRNRRRRGRNGSDATGPEPSRAEDVSDADFGSGVEAASPGPDAPGRNQGPDISRKFDSSSNPPQMTSESVNDFEDEANSEDDAATGDEPSDSGQPGNSRRRRNRRRGRRRGRGPEGTSGTPAE